MNGLSQDRFATRRLGLVIFIIAALIYLNSLSNGFVWDDTPIISQNRLLTGLENLPRLIASPDSAPGIGTTYYRPVTYLSFFVNRMTGGENPFGFHLVNILLHAAVSLALFALITLLFGDRLLAFLAAILFATHPINSETVNFLSGGRNTLLSALFALLTFIDYVKGRSRRSLLWFSLSVFSKEFGLVLPLMLYAHDRLVSRERKPFGAYAPYIAVVVLYLAARTVVLKGAGTLDLEILGDRLLFVPRQFADYLRVLLFSVVPQLPGRTELPLALDGGAGIAALILIGAGVFFYRFRSFPVVRFAGFWLLLFFLPVSNILPIGYTLMADRYAYFMSMAVSLLIAFALLSVFRNRQKAIAVAALMCIVFSVMVVRRNMVWRSDETLYRQMIVDSPDSSIGYYNLGLLLYEKGETEQALNHLQKAASTVPYSSDAPYLLGFASAELGMIDNALSSFHKTIARDPEHFMAYLLLSRLYESRGDHVLAESYRSKALELLPNLERIISPRAERIAGDAWRMQARGAMANAKSLFQRALLFDPLFPEALVGLTAIQPGKGDSDPGPFFEQSDNCSKCHSMREAYDSWKASPHSRAGCLECHEYDAKRMAGNQLNHLEGNHGAKHRTIVNRASCLAKGCHEQRLTDPIVRYSRRDIFFDHTHATGMRRGIISLRCRSCHAEVGHGKEKNVAKEVCFLCHFKNTGKPQQAFTGCPSCHPAPKGNIVFKGMVFSHEKKLRQGYTCQDCHRKVVKGNGNVPRERCSHCHPDRSAKYGDKALIHKKHVEGMQIYCFECHEKIEHGKIEVSDRSRK